jgi:phosphoribosyl-AMP cyclohydrolase / phosphoribosyl-ATP pyrophosphohydrolase
MKLPTFKYDDGGLLPVVVQDHQSGDVLMVAWANAEAMGRTAETGYAHFWSRSRQSLWKKGETSGNTMKVLEVRADCDGDAALLVVEPAGPACHTGTRTCFGERSPSRVGLLDELEHVIASRAAADPGASYTARLLQRGLDHTLKKVGEEATEVLLAAKGESGERLAEESADLIFHLLVALRQRDVPLALVLDVLARRRGHPPEEPAE